MEAFFKSILDWMVAHPLIVILIILVIYVIFTYNNLNAKKQRVEKSFSKIDVYLQARFDKLTSLFEQTMKAYDHESNVYKEVARLRSGIVNAKSSNDINTKVSAENEVMAFAASPLMRTEAYPELTAIKEMATITANATITSEEQLIAARSQYNSNATSYNTKIKSFPAMLLAGVLGFNTPFTLFKAQEEAKERPSIYNSEKK